MIIYFSTTGNSLTVARNLAKELNDKAFHINEAINLKNIDDDRIGLIFPCYFMDMPIVVQKFVENFDFSRANYIFGILTHGGDPGNSLLTMKTLLESRGLEMAYGNDIKLPVNSRIMYGLTTTDIDKLIGQYKQKLPRLVEDIEKTVINTKNLKKKPFSAMMTKLTSSNFAKSFYRITVDNNTCTQCGICEKLCPVGNIQLKGSGIKVHDHCETSLACMHWCPQVAIGFGKRKVRKDQQYHHPEVKLSDLVLEKKYKY